MHFGVTACLPALLLCGCVLLGASASRLLPRGGSPRVLLVRLPDDRAATMLGVAGAADARVLSVAAPGWALLLGDAARARALLGTFAVLAGDAAGAMCGSPPNAGVSP